VRILLNLTGKALQFDCEKADRRVDSEKPQWQQPLLELRCFSSDLKLISHQVQSLLFSTAIGT